MTKKSFFILYDFAQSAGGGKSFLASLKDYLIEENLYAESADKADIIIINSHNHLKEAQNLKSKYNGLKTFIHRIDGPMRIYQSHFDVRDFQVQFLLDYVSDGAIFQSKWSKKNHESLYGETKIPCTVIHNAANHRFFSPPDISAPKNKIKIIGSSWSHQKNKGGDYYDFLEENLDFDRFEMCFAGKTFSKYSKIKSLGILDQKQLGEELKKNHIYFFPSLYEACSNALLEGIASGLVPIVRAGSSNMELVPDSRLYFETHQQALDRLNNIDLNHNYQFLNPHFNAVAKQYVDFAQSIVPKFRELDFTVQSLQLKLKTYSYKFAHMIHRLTEH